MGKEVTLSNGRRAVVTRDNYEDLAREDQASYAAKGIDIDLAAHTQAFLQEAGAAAPLPAVNAAAQRVLDNPFARWSESVLQSTPAGFRTVWQGASDGAVALPGWAGDKVSTAARATRDAVQRFAKAALPAFDTYNTTLRVLAVSAAASIVVLGGAYAVHKFKR